jgi:hypothetical protein
VQDSLPNVQHLRDRWSPRPQAGQPKHPAGAPQRAPGAATAPTHHLTRRVAAAVAALGVILLAALLIATLSAGSEPPPATGAAALVPSDALLYIHLSTDPARPGVQRAQALLKRLPNHGSALSGLAQRIVAVVGGSPRTDFTRDIRPWLGKEAAFALLNSSGASAGSVIVLAVRDRALATRFIDRQGAQPAGGYDGAALYRYPTGAELAFMHGYLVVGQDSAVRASLDAAAHRRASLEASRAYTRAAATEPAGRVLDVYFSASGVLRVLGPRGGLLGLLGSLLDRPGLQGSAISFEARSHGLLIELHSVLDKSARTQLEAFAPTLASVLPAGSTLMFDGRNLSAIGPMVLAASGRLGLLTGVPVLLHRIAIVLTAEGYDVHGLMALFRGETAIALAAGSGAPALVIVSRTSQPQAARTMLASLEAPLSQMFTAPAESAGFTPQFNDVQFGTVTAHQMLLAPGLQFDYAVFHGLIVVSTSLRGIGDIVQRTHSLAGERAYQGVLGNQPSSVTSLGFADFSQLLSLFEQSQLARSATFSALLPDLADFRAVGMDSTRGEADTTTDVLLDEPAR